MPDVYVAGESQRVKEQGHTSPKASLGAGSERVREEPQNVVGGVPRLAVVREVIRRTGEVVGSKAGGAYVVCPNSRFVNEQSDEEVVLLLRAHPITNLKWILIAVVMLVVPEVLIAIGMFAGVPAKFVLVGRLTWYLVILGFALEKFLYWYYSVVIVTNERIVDIDFVNLLHRMVSYAALNHIEEPLVVAGGLFRSLWHFGDVHVATAADTPSVEAHAVPYPDRVIRVIAELSEELEKRRERGE